VSAYGWSARVPVTGSLSRRAAAFLADSLVVFTLAWIVTFVLASAGALRIPDVEVNGEKSQALGLLALVSIVEASLTLTYFTAFEAAWGRTPGKMLVGLRVARVGGERASLFDCFLRNLLRFLWVTPFFPIFLAIDAWSLRTTELDQRLGDLAAGTLVLDARAANL